MKILYAVIFTFIIGNTAFGQTFTRVTDPLNPITTDAFNSGGGSWVDINNDGLLDLFVSNGNLSSENNSIYLNTGNGHFIKVLTGSIVNDGGTSIGSTWGDFNNDGFLDCFVTNRSNHGNFLYIGTGDTVFTKENISILVNDVSDSNSSSWVDFNNDGNLDLCVINFNTTDYLYMNSGPPNYTFTSQPAINTTTEFSIPGAWGDINNDMYPDLYIGNAGNEDDNLYRNNAGTSFAQEIYINPNPTLGASWGDFNNDGNLDLFSASYLDSASILYKNTGKPSYALGEVVGSTVAIKGNSVGSAWGDVDNDGDLDLFVGDDGNNNHLFLNDGAPNYTFTEVSTGGIVTDGGNTFGVVLGDYDNDGQLDAFVANRLGQQNFLYHNDGNSNHWITIKCFGQTSNKAAIGTKVYVKAAINGVPTWQMQEVEGQTGYNSQNLWLHFGLGQTATIDSVIIKWPSGQVDSCINLVVDNIYDATEGECPTITGVKEIANKNNFNFSVSPNPFSQQLNITYKLKETENVIISIYDLMGKNVKLISNEKQELGFYKISFNTPEIENGIYFIKLQTGNYQEVKKIILVK